MADTHDTGIGGRREPLADERVEVPVVSSERVFEGRVWDVRRDAFEFGGETIVREYMDHTGAVGVLALDDHDRVLLIKQYRHPVRSRDWEIPAGLLDIDGEPPLAAAKRELAEEADLEASDWAVLSDFATSPGGSDELIRVYLARGLTATAEAFAREGEEADMETRWVPLDECVDAVLDRRIRNAPLAIAVLAAAAARARDWSSLGAADAPWPGQSIGRTEPPRR
ncbi:NUDIX domain-containing protein [Agromyces cerinus]|uniref:ADP-ribose pyrophosphatase n=1 Tax=Agromyces cerinus subsp. cerinus TaxID=232089 RepID=A0A1N6E9F8_9MICO|nr:NUDIX hydrolase [Agromyces cerinus]SIN79632.1 ADP-ribose pyrophosphatase [Agromyces cerinus subsp. cerinus]